MKYLLNNEQKNYKILINIQYLLNSSSSNYNIRCTTTCSVTIRIKCMDTLSLFCQFLTQLADYSLVSGGGGNEGRWGLISGSFLPSFWKCVCMCVTVTRCQPWRLGGIQAEVTGICGRQAGCNTSELYNWWSGESRSGTTHRPHSENRLNGKTDVDHWAKRGQCW